MTENRNDLIELLKKSVQTVFDSHFGINVSDCHKTPKANGFAAVLPITFKDEQLIVTLWSEKKLLEKIAFILLMEETSSDLELQDVALEMLNLIVGHAKVVASDQSIGFSMETPKWIGKHSIDCIMPSCDDVILFQTEENCMALSLKKASGE